MAVDYFILFWLLFIFPFLDAAAENANKRIFEGRHLVIGTMETVPFIYVERNKGNITKVDGFAHQIVAWMAEKYKFTYHYVESPDGAYGAFINNSWVGLVGMVVRGEIDMVGADLSLTYPRSLVIDFTIAFSNEAMALLIPYPQLDSTISGIVKPFQYKVWLGIVVSLIIASITLWFISRFELRNLVQLTQTRNTGWFPNFWFLFRSVANPDAERKFSLSMRWVVAAWCLSAIVFVNSYTSSLVSYLMAPKFLPLINTVQELADSRDLKIAVLKFSAIDSTIFAATTGPMVKLGVSLRANPENLLSNLDNMEDKVYDNNLAIPYLETTLHQKIHNDLKKTGKCRLFIAKESLYPDQVAFGLPKSDPMAQIYNEEIMWMSQLGLLNHWKSSFLPPPNRCSAPLSSIRPRVNERLTINYLSSAFLLYGVGVVLSLLAFVLERLFFLWMKKH